MINHVTKEDLLKVNSSYCQQANNSFNDLIDLLNKDK